MKFAFSLILFIALLPAAYTEIAGQDTRDEQSLESMQLQLIDVQAKENELEGRLRQLAEDLKPENIERSLAGIGSTKPEELREQRRRQLSLERDSVNAELKLVTSGRERLEAAIRAAERAAYEQSAAGPVLPTGQTMKADREIGSRWWIAVAGGFAVLLGIGLVIASVRRRSPG